MVEVPIILTDEKAKLPTKAHEDDACFDVVAVSKEITEDYIEYGLGFKTEIPKGYEGLVRPRSSISKYDLVMCNSIGTIDAGYRGEWKVRFKIALPPVAAARQLGLPDGRTDLKLYEVGDKVAQICFKEVLEVKLNIVSDLSVTERGEGGFGHTGK
jgi:dUTP pyrophosphatase